MGLQCINFLIIYKPNLIVSLGMVLTLPNHNSYYESTSYTDIYLFELLWNIGIYGVSVFAVFLIFLSLKLYQLNKKKQIQQNRESLLTYQSRMRNSQLTTNRESAVVIRDSGEQEVEPLSPSKRKPSITVFDLINYVTSFAYYLTLVCLAGLYLSCYMFGKFGRGTGHDILSVVLMFVIVSVPTVIWKKYTRNRNQHYKNIKRQIIFTIVMLLLWLGLSIFGVIALRGACMCIYNPNYGYNVRSAEMFSTEFTRSLEIQKVCQDGKIRHIYATLPQNGTQEVFINIHAGKDLENISVVLKEVKGQAHGQAQIQVPAFRVNNNKPFKLHNIQYIAQRNLFTFYFSQLKADTLYSVTAINTDTNSILYQTTYRTMPSSDAEEVRLAIGGDLGLGEASSILTQNLYSYDPHVLMFGGDNTYDNGLRTCWHNWDNFYDIINQLSKKLNRLVPFILTIGNHDVGYHALASVNTKMDDLDNLPLYFLYNPQHKGSPTDPIPDFKDRRSHHFHIIGSSLHVNLDSGYIQKYLNQAIYLQNVVTQFPNLLPFVNYHNPVYPSCLYDLSQNGNQKRVIEESFKYWTPTFEKKKVVAAFEHHTHFRKITYRMKNDTISKSDGVRYVGDGSWGVPEDPCPEGHRNPKLQNFQNYQYQHPNHVWKVRILRSADKHFSVSYRAVNITGDVVFQTVDLL